MLRKVNFVNPLERILIIELTDYMLYDFEASLDSYDANDFWDGDPLQAVITALTICVGKYQNKTGDELEEYINFQVLENLNRGYHPRVALKDGIIELFKEYLSVKVGHYV